MRKERAWSDELFSRAVDFHGHRGPYLAIGLRIGLVALNKLGARGWFDLRCRVYLPLKPPESCTVDGIQFSTGCTLGKRNIEVEEGPGIKAEFIKSQEFLTITLREEVLRRIRSELSMGSGEKLLSWLAEAEESELFIIERG
ncbi:MAG: formylmethanofuran dehydrogenase subunit E family protein [Candidatus Bathyarchaeia archaeon]